MTETSSGIDLRRFSPLALAYLGDAVYDLFIREKVLLAGNRPVTDLHKTTVAFVNAAAQASAAHFIDGILNAEEKDVLKWGRNAKGHAAPKNAAVADYRLASGFEALIGYLYLNGRNDRLREILEESYKALGQHNKE